jgi:hypothetical protein
MITLQRSLNTIALFAALLAALGAVAWLAPATLPSSSAGASADLPLSVQYERAVSFDAFLSSETETVERWRRYYAESDPAVQALLPEIRDLAGQWKLLVVAEVGCGDALNSVPHFARLADASPNLELRILRRKEGAALLEVYQLDGRGRIPLVLLLDEHLSERAVWIERPAALRQRIEELRAEPGQPDIGSGIRAWYAADGGRSALAEIVTLLNRASRGGGVVHNPDLDAVPTQCGAP